MSMEKDTIELGLAAAASKTTYAGAGTTVAGFLLSNEFALAFGMVMTVAGVAVNWYYKARSDRRAQQEHELRMERIRAGQHTEADAGPLT